MNSFILKRPLIAGVALLVAVSSLVSAQAGINIDRESYVRSGGTLDLFPGDVFHTWGDTVINAMAFNNHGIDVNVDGNFQVGTTSWCEFRQWGGLLNVGGYLSIGRYGGSSAFMDFYGGTVNSYNREIIVGEEGTGYLSLLGGSIYSYNGLSLGLNGGWGGVYLNSGNAMVGGIWKGNGYGELIMNGGWITAQRSNWDFISGLNLARIDGGNAYINNNGYHIGINQTLSGTGGANFYGNYATTLRQNNTYSGDTVVNAGALDFYESGSLYNNGTEAGNIYVQSGASLHLNRDNIFGNADTGSSSPVSITVNGGLINNGNGGVTGGGTFNNLANLTLNGGELRANGGADYGWNAYELNNVTVGGTNASTITANTSLNSNNAILLSRAGTTTFNVGVTGDARGDLLVSANLIDGNGVVGSLTKTGLGTMVLSGNNAYTGTTAIASGVLDFVNANSLYNGTAGSWTASNITVSNGATLALGVGGSNSFTTDNVETIIANLSGTDGKGFLAGSSIGFDTTAGNFTATNRITDSVNGSLGLWVFGGNTLSVTGANTYSGTTTISAGTLQVGNGGTSGTLGSGAVVNNSSLVFNRSDNYGGSISNAISGSGSLTVMGGSLTLSASNTYSGLTTVSGGTLAVNGSIAGALQVDAGATLKGSGSIAGAATIAGTHGPGNSPGIQSFGSSLSYKSTSTVLLEFTQNSTTGREVSFDGIDVAGDLSFDPGAVMSLTFNGVGSSVNWNDPLWNNYVKTSDGWLLYSVGGTLSGLNNLTISGSFLDSNGLALSSARPNSYFNLYQSGNNVYLNYAVPEPSTYALFGIGALALIMAYRRRRRVQG